MRLSEQLLLALHVLLVSCHEIELYPYVSTIISLCSCTLINCQSGFIFRNMILDFYAI